MFNEDKRLIGSFDIASRNDGVNLVSSLATLFSGEVLKKFPIVHIEAPVAKTFWLDGISSVVFDDPSLIEPRGHSFLEDKADQACFDFVQQARETRDKGLIAVQFTCNLNNVLNEENFQIMRDRLRDKFPDADGGITFISSMLPSQERDFPDVSIHYHMPQHKMWSFSGEVRCKPAMISGQGDLQRMLNKKFIL